MTWTLQYGTTVDTLAGWKMQGITKHQISQAVDALDFKIRSSSGATTFDRNATLTIRKDDAVWFVGEVRQVPNSNAPQAERDFYHLIGPWTWLEELIYQQPWHVLQGLTLTTYETSHLLLNYSSAGRLATGTVTIGGGGGIRHGQIEAAINYAITCGAPFATPVDGDIDLPECWPPILEVRDRTLAEVIRSQLVWHPDATTWWTYDEDGKARFHCKGRVKLNGDWNMPATTYEWLPAVGRQYLHQAQLTPRWDLVRPGVVLRFERTGKLNGRNRLEIVDQVYPPGASAKQRYAYVQTFDLRGLIAGTLRSKIEVQKIDDFVDPDGKRGINSLAFWKWIDPALNDKTIKEGTLAFFPGIPPFRKPDSASFTNHYLPNVLVKGQICDWMKKDNGNLGASEQDTVTAGFKCEFNDGTPTGPVHRKDDAWMRQVDFTATDLETDDYSLFSAEQLPDWIPTGLAEVLYKIFERVQYEGTITLRERELSGRMGMGTLINITGHRPEYASMYALPQSVTESIPDAGPAETVVSCGVAAHLDVPGLLSLLR